jgi:iron(III) transport system substrate-binding protein
MTRFAKVRVRFVASLAVLVLAILGASAATAAKSKVPVIKPYTAAEWNAIVAKAKQEGSVTIYSSQHPVYLQDFANGFKEKYGITVNVNRNVDTVLVTQITAEQGTGNLKADFWVSASKPQVLGGLKNGWVADARGPSLYMSRYDRAKYAKPGKAFAVGAAVLGIAWNSKAVPQGIKDYPGFLNQSLAGGKIGVPDPKAAPAFIDFYLWLQENYGASYLTRLAAMKPKIYISTLPMQQATTSGEIAGDTLAPATTRDLKSQGAPVDFAIPPKGAWNAPWWGMVLKQAPHPNAAQLLADFMVTPEGQALVHKNYGSVLKGVPGTFYVPLRNQKLSNFTPAKVKAFNETWDRLFR